MDNKTKIEEKIIYANIGIPESLNWKIKEEAMRRKTTKETTIILILQERMK